MTYATYFFLDFPNSKFFSDSAFRFATIHLKTDD